VTKRETVGKDIAPPDRGNNGHASVAEREDIGLHATRLVAGESAGQQEIVDAEESIRPVRVAAIARFESDLGRGVPRKEAMKRTKATLGVCEFDFRPGVRIRQGLDGVYWVSVSHTREGDEQTSEVLVIADRMIPIRRIVVEDHVYVEVEILPGLKLVETVPGVLGRLDKDGRLLNHGYARDVLPALLHHTIPKPESAHPTWGFYAEGNRIVECRQPTPVRPEQELVWSHMRTSIGREYAAEDLGAWVDVLGFYQPWEALPVLGSAIAAPFAYIARCERELVPHVLLWSKSSGLGKSTLAEASTDDLYHVESATGSSLNSEFRFPAHLDSYCGPMGVSEAQGLHWKLIGPDLKASAEGGRATRRGKSGLDMNDYRSRLVAIMSSNTAPPLTPTELVRLILIHMDESSKDARVEKAPAFEVATSKLRGRCFGPSLSRLIRESYPTVGEFMGRRSSLADEIRDAAKAARFSFNDGRRPGAWAHVLLGLEAFGRACAEKAVPWKCPDVAQFLSEVIIPIERAAAEAEVTPLQSFRSFLANFRLEHTVRHTSVYDRQGVVEEKDSVKGEGSVIFADALDLNEGVEGRTAARIPGDWITKPILDRYNEECDKRQRPELRFASLKELSERTAIEAGFPPTAFLRFDKEQDCWKVRQPHFPIGRRFSAGFVPSQEGTLAGTIEGYG
jgi:hypothetical protein